MTEVPIVKDGVVIGHRKHTYDAWGRLVQVEADVSTIAIPVNKTVMTYDGLGRRISKTVTASGDLNGVYHFYYDGQRVIEIRDADDQMLKQQVWGPSYVDELVQIGINQDPKNASSATNAENVCERFFFAFQGANFNVLGVMAENGDLIERHVYDG